MLLHLHTAEERLWTERLQIRETVTHSPLQFVLPAQTELPVPVAACLPTRPRDAAIELLAEHTHCSFTNLLLALDLLCRLNEGPYKPYALSQQQTAA